MTPSIASQSNPFRTLWDQGYKRLVPIVPPDAELSPHSSLFKRPGGRGKAVGELGPHGWRGFDWHKHVTTEDDLDRWHAMGAGIGCRMGEGLVAIDVDALDRQHALAAMEAAFEILGPAPIRIGRSPKMLLLYRCDVDVAYQRVEFEGTDGTTQRVEVLGPGQQGVFDGIHPGTGKPYRWPNGLPCFDDLTVTTVERVRAFFDRLLDVLPKAAQPASSNGQVRDLVDQDKLTGELEAVQRAVAAIPNDRSDRSWYLRMGYAIKAALRDHPDEAFDLFWEWCGRWSIREKDHDKAWSFWTSLRPPFAVGAPYLYGQAATATGENMMPPEQFFEPVPDEPGDDAPKASAIAWIDPASWVGAERPEQKWIVHGLVPDGEVTLLTGKGGIGKTLLVQQLLTHIALGLPWLGREVPQGKVMGFFCEDSEDVLHGRQKDICMSLCADLSDLSGTMRISSRKYMDNLLSVWDRTSLTMRRSVIFDMLLRDALAFGAKVVALDTIADTFGGDEINRQQVRQFIQACAGKLAAAIGGSVILLGHPSKSGEQTGDGTSGSTAWHATVRSRLYLEEAGKAGSGFRKLTSMKANYGPAGDSWVLRWSQGVLEVVSSSGVSVAGVPATASEIERVVLEAVQSANEEGVRLALGKTSKFRAEPLLRRRDPGAFAPYSAHDVDEALQTLFATGQLVERAVGKDANRHPLMTLVPTTCLRKPSVFD